jgi:hypothetical protein
MKSKDRNESQTVVEPARITYQPAKLSVKDGRIAAEPRTPTDAASRARFQKHNNFTLFQLILEYQTARNPTRALSKLLAMLEPLCRQLEGRFWLVLGGKIYRDEPRSEIIAAMIEAIAKFKIMQAPDELFPALEKRIKTALWPAIERGIKTWQNERSFLEVWDGEHEQRLEELLRAADDGWIELAADLRHDLVNFIAKAKESQKLDTREYRVLLGRARTGGMKEAAAELNITEDHAYQILHGAREKLRDTKIGQELTADQRPKKPKKGPYR